MKKQIFFSVLFAFSIISFTQSISAQQSNSDAKKDKVGQNIIPWSEFPSASKINNKSLNNKIQIYYSESDLDYAIVGIDNSIIQMASGSSGGITFSGGMKAKSITGSAQDGILDDQLYLVIGIGTEIKLPSTWIDIGGIKFRNGMIKINENGVILMDDAEKLKK